MFDPNITRLRVKHHEHVKISTDGNKIYQKCENCTNVELTPHHVFNWSPAVVEMHSLDHLSENALHSDLVKVRML